MNYPNNSENNDSSLYVGTKLPRSSKACELVENRENKSEFVRYVLNDFASANGFPREYSSIPEKDRLRKFFGVAVPRQEIRQKLQAELAKMKENKNILINAVEYVAFWVDHYRIFLPDDTFTCFISQFAIPNAKRLAEVGLPEDGLGYAIMDDMEAFGKKCRRSASTTNGRAELEACEKKIGLAERLFIMLVYQWYSISIGLMEMSMYSAEAVVDMALEFMDDYLNLDYWNDMFLAPLFTRFVRRKLRNKENSGGNPTPALVAPPLS